MHLVETYALNSGLTIDRPFIYQKYFPVPFDKYILIHAGGGFSSKFYDYYNEVIAILQPILKEYGIEVMQTGGDKDPPLNGIVDLRGKSDLHQTAFLIKKASLVIGNDSCIVHLADALDTPVIALYGPTRPSNSGPFFGPPEKKILIESDRGGNMPSFSYQEDPKTINYIKPEEVAKAALKLLNIDKKVTRETLYIGSDFNSPILDVVMDTIISPEAFPGAILNARMDLDFNEERLAQNLSIRPFTILTDKEIPLQVIETFRRNIAGILYQIKQGYSTEFIKNLTHNGIKYGLWTYLEEETLGQVKLDFFDYGLIDIKKKMSKESLENHEKMTTSTLYKTNKFLLSGDKIYLNEIDWKNKKPIESFEKNVNPIDLKDPDFFSDASHYYIFNE